jgi:formylmethanofuran dehydrogenase subunit E
MGVFLDLFLDESERLASQAHREAHDAMFYGGLALHNVDLLRAQVLTQREQIRDLSVLVGVLVKMLGETSVVDPAVLKYRVQAVIEERIEAAKPENRKVECRRCRKLVVAANTEMTADGAVCDVCMATRR